MSNILITGVSGFLGTEIASQIMRTTEDRIYGLIRASSYKEASDRLLALWYERPELKDNIGTRVIPVPGDITRTDLGLSPEDESLLVHNTDYIIHTAALIGINHTREEFWSVNVTGTEHMLDLAGRIQKDHGLKRFSHVSTAYVAGSRSGLMMEDSLIDAGFSSLYEQSKFEGDIIQSSVGEVEERIETVLKSLQSLGAGPGSRVAISGINSVSYFILDAAIGLSGAASVPLYYTTPAGELNELLKKSGAGWFFIGDKRILSNVNRLKFDGKIVSFTDKNEEGNVSAENTEEKNLTENEQTSEKRHNSTNPCVMSWDEFIALGNGKDITPVQVSYDDIATIRYTDS